MPNFTIIANTPEVLKGTSEAFSVTVYDAGVAATISSASYALYNSGGTEKSSGSVTPASGVLAITILATHFPNVEESCRVKWTFVVGGITYVDHSLFDVVATKIWNSVLTSDLQKYHPNLTDDLWNGETNFDTQLQLAFNETKGDLKNKGLTPAGIVDGSQVKRMVIFKAFQLIFEDFSRDVGDIWEIRAEKAGDRYDLLIENTPIVFDQSGDEIVDSKETQWGVELMR